VIKLEQIWKVFPDGTEAVKDVSLEINEGEFCVFLGPSGCGKTTSLKMINRLIPLTRGTIYVNGVDAMSVNANELRRGIGYAIQNIGLFPHLTVAENIATVPRLNKWPKNRSELSGGQQQRVGVARCLGADPPILLMDEPFGAIDPITRNKLQDEFMKIQDKIKKTIVFVTHDIHEAIKMGDRIALMRQGELIQYADPGTLLREPKNEFVRNFVGADRTLKGLRLHRVRDVMKKPPLTAKLGEEPAALKRRMEQQQLLWSMLTDEEGHFLGWITHEDIRPDRPLRGVVRPPTVTATEETPLNEALSMMLGSAIGTLSVLDADERLVGVVSFDMIRDVLSEEQPGGSGGGKS
jgi:osmoprotectant transport system ATP-binding protein